MIRNKIPLLALILLLTVSCISAYAEQPKNVIFFIGDGMGVAQVTLTRLSLDDPDAKLHMDTMPVGGLQKTQAANAVVTDSAASATALATGFKTNNGMIATLPDGTEVKTILQAAQEIGKATGIVTTTTITHATPASFGAHVRSRASEADIAPQLIENEIDVLIGGGRANFIPQDQPGSKREDNRDLIAEAKAAGYDYAESRIDLMRARGDKLLGLFQMEALTCRYPEPSIADLTMRAVRTLSKNPNGFFLMVEGGQIDWRGHANDDEGVIKHTLDFDEAIGKALEFARLYGDTLIIVTADHETGGLTVIYPDKDSDKRFKTAWSTTGHSGADVPIFAEGPGAYKFGGVLDNTDVPKRIAELWGISNFPAKR